MNATEFKELAKNDMVAALIWLHAQLEAAELTVASLLGDHVEPVAE